MGQIREWIEFAAQGIEILAVAIMVSFIIIGTARWVFHSVKRIAGGYERYRVVMGKTLLVGLELLVAADIIRTVALDLTLINIALLGASWWCGRSWGGPWSSRSRAAGHGRKRRESESGAGDKAAKRKPHEGEAKAVLPGRGAVGGWSGDYPICTDQGCSEPTHARREEERRASVTNR